MSSIKIAFKFPGLNKYIQAERGSRFAASMMKKKFTAVAREAAEGYVFTDYPVDVVFTWHVKPNRGKYQDPDNIAFNAKFIFDGLVDAGALTDDTKEYIHSITHRFIWDSEKDVVEIEG